MRGTPNGRAPDGKSGSQELSCFTPRMSENAGLAIVGLHLHGKQVETGSTPVASSGRSDWVNLSEDHKNEGP